MADVSLDFIRLRKGGRAGYCTRIFIHVYFNIVNPLKLPPRLFSLYLQMIYIGFLCRKPAHFLCARDRVQPPLLYNYTDTEKEQRIHKLLALQYRKGR